VSTAGRWYSPRLEQDITVARWGHYGTPVLLFPTAGGDAFEAERHGLVEACGPLLEAGRVKLYSCDSTAGQAMLHRHGSVAYRMWLFNQFHECVRREVVPAIHADLGGQQLPVVVAGASIGAYNALGVLCRYPEAFRAAVCMSGTYEIQRFLEHGSGEDLYLASAVQFLPGLEGPQLDAVRSRFAVLATGSGDYEDVEGSWAAGAVLGSKGIPNRVDVWGPEWHHDWPTWLRMLPQYLDELA
jgi:esterase/lipase superfamily enzyme